MLSRFRLRTELESVASTEAGLIVLSITVLIATVSLKFLKRIELHVFSHSINEIRIRPILGVFVPTEDPIKWRPKDECIVNHRWEKNTRRGAKQNNYPVVDAKKHQCPTHTNYKR